MTSLVSVACLSPSQQFLQWGTGVGLGSGIMLGVSAAALYAPGNPILRNVWLYGGLGVFGMATIFDI
jgi:hypothetical protein